MIPWQWMIQHHINDASWCWAMGRRMVFHAFPYHFDRPEWQTRWISAPHSFAKRSLSLPSLAGGAPLDGPSKGRQNSHGGFSRSGIMVQCCNTVLMIRQWSMIIHYFWGNDKDGVLGNRVVTTINPPPIFPQKCFNEIDYAGMPLVQLGCIYKMIQTDHWDGFPHCNVFLVRPVIHQGLRTEFKFSRLTMP